MIKGGRLLRVIALTRPKSPKVPSLFSGSLRFSAVIEEMFRARKIVDTSIVDALDQILPTEITDIILDDYLENSKRTAKTLRAIANWDYSPGDHPNVISVDNSTTPKYDYYATQYANGVIKEVIRCSECQTVKEVTWVYVKENDTTWNCIGKLKTRYWDCDKGHSERGTLIRENDPTSIHYFPIIAEDRITLHLEDSEKKIVFAHGFPTVDRWSDVDPWDDQNNRYVQ
jgi:hypothetical protein